MHSFLSLLEDAMKLFPSGYKFTFKPHPCYAVKLADYAGIQADETTEALDRILGEYDIVLAANSTSASVDAYVAGLPVIIGLDEDELNLSPLRGRPDVRFVSTPEELADALRSAEQGIAANPNHDEFFFMDPELPRWKRLLSSTSPV
jgi:surface carbohydrate biosynthesis protein (TIGR04326 family)